MPPRKSRDSTASKKRAATQDSGDEESDGGQGTDYSNDGAPAKGKKKSAAAKGKGKKRAAAGGSDEEGDDATTGKGKRKGKSAPMNEAMRNKLIMEITRHALFCESNRKPFKPEDVRKTILTQYPRAFPDLFPAVKSNLRRHLGMELVKMRQKEGGKGQVLAYILRSTLPSSIIRDMVERDDKLLPEPNGDEQPEDRYELLLHEFMAEEGYARDVKKEEGGAYGVIGVILALILVSGKVLGEDQLIVYLKKVFPDGLEAIIPASFASRPVPKDKENGLSMQKFLNQLASQGYLEKGKSGTGATQGKSQKNQQQSGDPTVEWKWGARAETEIGEVGVARFVQTIYESKAGERADSEEDEEMPAATAKKARTGEKLMDEIARAAGSKTLAEVTTSDEKKA
ncbi:hypothetical protein P7C70_g5830, partial [Phenoliferia sp. Uapishka_3]